MLNILNFALQEFGMPKKLVINGYTEPKEELEESISVLKSHSNEITSIKVALIDGGVSLYITTK